MIPDRSAQWVWRQSSDHAFIKSRGGPRRIARRWKTLNGKTGERLRSEILSYAPALLAKLAEQNDNRLPIGSCLQQRCTVVVPVGDRGLHRPHAKRAVSSHPETDSRIRAQIRSGVIRFEARGQSGVIRAIHLPRYPSGKARSAMSRRDKVKKSLRSILPVIGPFTSHRIPGGAIIKVAERDALAGRVPDQLEVVELQIEGHASDRRCLPCPEPTILVIGIEFSLLSPAQCFGVDPFFNRRSGPCAFDNPDRNVKFVVQISRKVIRYCGKLLGSFGRANLPGSCKSVRLRLQRNLLRYCEQPDLRVIGFGYLLCSAQ